uniref:Uncharacterized protein n=1 Tax=Oryza punctata TaxID=4537 RepID=A0A0E0KVL0_ORYPU
MKDRFINLLQLIACVHVRGGAHRRRGVGGGLRAEACSFAAPAWSDRSGNTTVAFDAAGTR